VVGALLGAAFILRALGDGASRARWLVWASPIGWGQRLEPFVGNHAAPLLLLFGFAAVLVGATFLLRARRDAGAGVVASSTRDRSMRPVRSAPALDWRLARGGLVAWASGVAFYGVLLGYLAGDIADFARKDKSVSDMFARLGGSSVLTVNGFLGLTFSLVAVVLAVYAGSQVSTGRTLETEGRVEPLVAARVSRVQWLSTRVAVGALSTLALAACAGLFAWVGTQVSGEGAQLTGALGGALNTVPVALLYGGLTVLAFGAVPKLTAATAFGAVAVTYLIQFVGAVANAPSWILDLSPFQHVAAVPFHPVNTTATVIMLAGALALFAIGTAAFRRRDLAEL
jgi:ABC-2 type transport system permease protein